MKFRNKRRWFYFRYVVLREWKVALLLLGLGGFFVGLYNVFADGIWDARQRAERLATGEVLSIWGEVGIHSRLEPRSFVRLRLENGQKITLRAKYQTVARCKAGDQIQVRIFMDESDHEYYRLGQKRCWNAVAELRPGTLGP